MKPPRSNLTRGERRAITELKKDKSRMVLTADKGVATGGAKHRGLPEEGTRSAQPKHLQGTNIRPNNEAEEQDDQPLEAPSSQKEDCQKICTRSSTPQGLGHPNSMGYQKYINLGCHSDP